MGAAVGARSSQALGVDLHPAAQVRFRGPKRTSVCYQQPAMRLPSLALLAAALCAVSACKQAPDPLDEHRKACRELDASKSLRAGLTVEECAKELKAAADARDPARRAEELTQRLAALVIAGKSGSDATQRQELRDTLIAVQGLGKPAVPALQQRMTGSQDPDLRIAVAKALVNICGEDCAVQNYSCIVPALLEGTTTDKPAEVRLESIKGLSRCTGQGFGDDPSAWRTWWSQQPQGQLKK
jgi:hypothetical protein